MNKLLVVIAFSLPLALFSVETLGADPSTEIAKGGHGGGHKGGGGHHGGGGKHHGGGHHGGGKHHGGGHHGHHGGHHNNWNGNYGWGGGWGWGAAAVAAPAAYYGYESYNYPYTTSYQGYYYFDPVTGEYVYTYPQ